MTLQRGLFPVLLLMLLAGCSSRPAQPVAPPPKPPVDLPADAQNCLTHQECTLKTSRTLLFVFAYASAGAPLVENNERVLSTPENAARTNWPTIRIQLADPDGGRFEFSSACPQKGCRIKQSHLLSCYRNYLDGKACRFR